MAATHKPAAPSQALAFASHPATDRASLAQAMHAAAHPAAPKTTVIAKAAVKAARPDRCRSRRPCVSPAPRRATGRDTKNTDTKNTGRKPGMPPRSKVAGMY